MSTARLRMPAPIANWMAEHSPAEQRIAAALAVVVAGALLWVAAWQPMTRDAALLRATRAANAVALGQARAMAKETGILVRPNANVAPTDARADLDRILAQQNLRPSVASIDWREGRAQLVLPAVSYDTLIAVLEALQRDARLRVVEATLTARVESGTVRAELTLAR